MMASVSIFFKIIIFVLFFFSSNAFSNNLKEINVIGNDYSKKDNYQKKYNFYDYFKDEIKELRKMAHYTFTD